MTTPEILIHWERGTRVIRLTEPGNYVRAWVNENGVFEWEAEQGVKEQKP